MFRITLLEHLNWPASKLSSLGEQSESREKARASGEGARGQKSESRENLSPSLARSREARFARLNRRACSQATPKCSSTLIMSLHFPFSYCKRKP